MAEELPSSPGHYLSLVLMIAGAGATAGDDSDHTLVGAGVSSIS